MSSISRDFLCDRSVLSNSDSSSMFSESDVRCVISLTMLQSYCESISIPYFGVFVDVNTFSSISPIRLINALFTLQYL